MRLCAPLLLAFMLAACAAVPVAAPPDVFEDSAFMPPSQPIRIDDIFAFSPEMKQFLDRYIAPYARSGPRAALLDALENDGQLKLEYDAEMTRNAAQAFAARSGNCLSLVLMTAAFAKQLGLTVEYQKVFVDDAW